MSPTLEIDALNFELPPDLEATEPPEARGLSRDDVRLMVSYSATDRVVHSAFRSLPEFMLPGDALVINTSGTMNASIPVEREDGQQLELHLSTRLDDGHWVVELRRPEGSASAPFGDAELGEVLVLPAGGRVALLAPYGRSAGSPAHDRRLWLAELDIPGPLHEYLSEHGSPIRYGYVRDRWDGSYYQTVYATETGSAEMPSAGRAFTPRSITRLVALGVYVLPLLLHTGVSSLESHERPYEEYYRVPVETARVVNLARENGGRIIAVGTTVVRALETVADPSGRVRAGEGWTDVVVTPERGVHAVDGLLTGLHEPRSSHLAMLEAIAGRKHLEVAYAEALRERYLWHEFGDLHLILPG